MSAQRFPDGNAYVEAVQNADNLKDPELRAGRYETRANGLPKPYSGGFTTTFQFQTAARNYAVRCFTRGNTDLARRYHAITDFLRLVKNPAFCQAVYIAEGIRVEARWWPIIKMVWVSGRQLNTDVESKLGNSTELLSLATKFRTVVRELGVLGVAHGDLQHGNIIVDNGVLRLIDYDGIYLPALQGMTASEFGHQNYQHPNRAAAPFDGRLDRFSSIVIYTALVALAADPGLWKRFNNDENLLFRATDFTSNGSSDLFRALLQLPQTQRLATNLIELCRMPCEQIPTLEQAIQTAVQGPASSTTRSATPSQSPQPQPQPASGNMGTPFVYTTAQQRAANASSTGGAQVWAAPPKSGPPPIPPGPVRGGAIPPPLPSAAYVAPQYSALVAPNLPPPRQQGQHNSALVILMALLGIVAVPLIAAIVYYSFKSGSTATARASEASPPTVAAATHTPVEVANRSVGEGETGSCSAPTRRDVDGMTAAIEGFHAGVTAHDWARAAAYENQRSYQSQDDLASGYQTTVSSQPIILGVTGCSVRVALRYQNTDKPEMCLEQRYDMEYLRDARPRWIIHTAHSSSEPAICA